MRSAMRRMLLGIVPGDSREVTHRDGDTLNLQRANLRVSERAEGLRYERRRRPQHSMQPWTSFRGVAWDASTGKWRATFRGKHLGLFDSDVAANEVVVAARATASRDAIQSL